jgi:Lipoprotein LpqB beta-propeller domain/Sporulation and spore germination
MGVLAAAVAALAGCVGMPGNGPAQQSTTAPQASTPAVNFIGPFPSGPRPGGDPSQIVQGFLLASASYPIYSIATEYLASSATQTWNPGGAVRVYSDNLSVPGAVPAPKATHGTGQQVTVNVSGTLQASFDGSGQYVSSQSQDQAPGSYIFRLAKVSGQWRITNPPNYRMLTASDFQLFYKAQDLYFFDPQSEVLVPDSVFVPLGATESQLLGNLVSALVAGPKTPWLQDAAITEVPAGATVLGVSVAGSTVTVNLGGQISTATASQLALLYAQLVWTLTGQAANLPSIQSVVLERDGAPWTPDTAVCHGPRSPGPYQTLAAYECFDPYPSSPSSFYYVEGGQLWARCGSEAQALQGLIGPVEPAVSESGVFYSQQCGAHPYVYEGSTATPPAQPRALPAMSMASVSPDGKDLAVVSADGDSVYIGSLSGGTISFPAQPRLTGTDITSVSWDGSDDLWVAENGSVVMLLPGSGEVPVVFNGSVSDLSVAPDGVRIAFIAQTPGQSPALYLAAIGAGQQNAGELGSPTEHLEIKDTAVIGPTLAHPASLAWYNANNLVVLDDAYLYEVPVDGQPAQQLPVTPSGITSITASGAANVLVAALSDNSLAVSTSLEGPWYRLGNPGQDPAYPG